MENNIQIKRQALNTDYSQNQVSQAKSDRLPNLNAGASDNFSFGRSLNVQNTYENQKCNPAKWVCIIEPYTVQRICIE